MNLHIIRLNKCDKRILYLYKLYIRSCIKCFPFLNLNKIVYQMHKNNTRHNWCEKIRRNPHWSLFVKYNNVEMFATTSGRSAFEMLNFSQSWGISRIEIDWCYGIWYVGFENYYDLFVKPRCTPKYLNLKNTSQE